MIYDILQYIGNVFANIFYWFSDMPVSKINLTRLNKLPKHEIIEHVKTLEIKNINTNSEVMHRLEDIELSNSNLIPMSIELYAKAFEQLGEAVREPVQNPQKIKCKKGMYVKPGFTKDDAMRTYLANQDQRLNTKPELITNDLVVKSIDAKVIESMQMPSLGVGEFDEAFNNNINKKDMMGIKKVMLKNMPFYLKRRFINTYNQILLSSKPNLISDISFGIGSYLYKEAKKGPANDIKSFRQVVSIPNSVSVMHKILANRIEAYFKQNDLLDTKIQKGGISGERFAIFEQFYKVKGVIKHANTHKKSCAVLFLDINNAFGSVSLDNLYLILEQYKVHEDFINYLKQYYAEFEYYINVNGNKTSVVRWGEAGLIQGCPLSLILFNIALNYVLVQLDNKYKATCGYSINDGLKILLIAYVDDVCICANNKQDLEIVFTEMTKLLGSINMTINKEKTALMTVNDNSPISEVFKDIQVVNRYKYLGSYVSVDGTSSESYQMLLHTLNIKLMNIDKRNISSHIKISFFEGSVLRYLQRSLMMMYDIDVKRKLKIMAIIKPYTDSWGYDKKLEIFANIDHIVDNTNDPVVKSDDLSDLVDDELDDDIIEHVVTNKINISYSEINDEFLKELKK